MWVEQILNVSCKRYVYVHEVGAVHRGVNVCTQRTQWAGFRQTAVDDVGLRDVIRGWSVERLGWLVLVVYWHIRRLRSKGSWKKWTAGLRTAAGDFDQHQNLWKVDESSSRMMWWDRCLNHCHTVWRINSRSSSEDSTCLLHVLVVLWIILLIRFNRAV